MAEWETTRDGLRFTWRGRADDGCPGPGAPYSARLDVWPAGDRATGPLARTVHRQRHHPEGAIRVALARAGLGPAVRYGQLSGARMVRPADEAVHPKILYLARKPGP